MNVSSMPSSGEVCGSGGELGAERYVVQSELHPLKLQCREISAAIASLQSELQQLTNAVDVAAHNQNYSVLQQQTAWQLSVQRDAQASLDNGNAGATF